MATKRKRGETWHYIVKRRHLLPKPINLSFKDESAGDAYVADLERLLDAGIVPSEFQEKREHNLHETITEYLQANAVSEQDREILYAMRENELKNDPLTAITYDWAESQVAYQKSLKRAPGTIRHKIGAMARCLDWAQRKGWIQANPLRLLPKGYATYADKEVEDEERDRRLEPGEEEAIRAVLSGEYEPKGQRRLEIPQREALTLMFDLALETAMRMRETYTLTWEQVDFPQRTIFLDKTKNGDKRQVPMSSVITEKLAAVSQTSGLVLPFFDGSYRKTTSRLSRQWARVFQHAGCEGLTYHCLRHEAASRFYERTSMTDLEISRITGHKTIRVLRRYSNLRAASMIHKMW